MTPKKSQKPIKPKRKNTANLSKSRKSSVLALSKLFTRSGKKRNYKIVKPAIPSGKRLTETKIKSKKPKKKAISKKLQGHKKLAFKKNKLNSKKKKTVNFVKILLPTRKKILKKLGTKKKNKPKAVKKIRRKPAVLRVNLNKTKKFAKKSDKTRKILKKRKKIAVEKKKTLQTISSVKPMTVMKNKGISLTKKTKIKTKEPKSVNKTVKGEEALFKARIRVVGIGGGGGSIVSEIAKSLNNASFVICDTDIRALKKNSGVKHFWFGKEFTHGLGTGVNLEMAKEAAESEKEKIADIFKEQDIVILVSSLGGGLGSGATQIFAKAAKSFGAITLGIFTLPFKFEGNNKSRIAQKALRELKDSLNVSVTISNEKIFKIIDSNTSITEAFSKVNKSLIESLKSLIDLIYNPGLINIDFADLRAILSGSGNYAFLNTAQASGKTRADDIVKKILVNPLYQNSNFNIEKILFNISGGADLNMFEVEKISKSIAELNPNAKIIFGISKNTQSKNKIKTTILMTGPQKTAKPVKIAAVIKVQKPKKANSSAKALSKIKTGKDISSVLHNSQTGEQTAVGLGVGETQKIKIKKIKRRNALEIKKAEALEHDKRLLQEEEWEVPAFLRRVKFKS